MRKGLGSFSRKFPAYAIAQILTSTGSLFRVRSFVFTSAGLHYKVSRTVLDSSGNAYSAFSG